MIGRGIVRRIRRIPLERAERRFQENTLARFDGEMGPQVFILGLPRSGTTLVYQYIVHRYHVAYFTNGVGAHPYDPCRETARQLAANAPYRSDFESRYGRSDGAMAPREAGVFWLRFFDIDAYQRFEDIPAGDLATLRRSVAANQALFGGEPFVNKNVKHLLRVDALSRIFPRAHFLVIERNMKDVALSVLRARIKTGGDYQRWFSVRPPDYDELAGLDPVSQVCGQLFSLRDRLDVDLAGVDGTRVHRVGYESFCARPDSLFDGLDLFRHAAVKNPAVEGFAVRAGVAETEMERELVRVVVERSAG